MLKNEGMDEWYNCFIFVKLLLFGLTGIAAQEGHEECVLWLLQHGADPLQADHCGMFNLKHLNVKFYWKFILFYDI